MKTIKTLLFSLLTILTVGCRESAFLDTVPNQALIIPKSLNDFQAILDNDMFMNGGGNSQLGVMPSISGVAAEEFTIPENMYAILPDYLKQVYTWQPEMPTFDTDLYDWTYPYRAIYYANTVLEGLANYTASPQEAPIKERLTGSALFFRAFMHYHLAEVFAPPYREDYAATDLGLPLRLKADLNERMERSSVQSTYNHILTDLDDAALLLPDLPDFATRPSKAAVFALSARIYLSMRKYGEALTMAEHALALKDNLLDYRTLDTSPSYTMPRFNEEVIFHAMLIAANTAARRSVLGSGISMPLPNLLSLYPDGDIRENLFFMPAAPYYFKASYN